MVSGLVSPSSTSGDPNHYHAHWCAVSSATASSFTCLSLSYWSFFFRCLFECGVLLPLLSLSILKIHLFPKFLNEFLGIHQDSLTSEEHASSTSGSKRSTALPSLKTPVASPASSSLLTKSAICELFIFLQLRHLSFLVISEKCYYDRMGSVHDGSPPPSYLGGPGAQRCRWEDGYIMSDLRHTDRGFKWSPCSIAQFDHFLKYRLLIT